MNLDTFTTLISRRTIHTFLSEEVSEETLQRGLEAAIRAPNHKLTNPWRFLRLGPELRPEIEEICVATKLASKQPLPGLEERVRAKFAHPAEIFVILQVLATDPFRQKEDYASVACAIQNFSLALWAEGVGSKWSTGGFTRADETYSLLELDRESEEILGFLFVGIPAEIPETPRKPVSEIYRVTK